MLCDFVDNEYGFKIAMDNKLFELAKQSFLQDFSQKFYRVADICDAIFHITSENKFGLVKNKENRILAKKNAINFLAVFKETSLGSHKDVAGITDEESLDYPNIYWRFVRANQPDDVGSIHADQWFWDLNMHKIPPGHRRIKIWMPLFQNDASPSLLVFPGSHKKSFEYGFKTDITGKKRPIFDDKNQTEKLICAPVKIGQQIVFHDSLLHGGRSTDTTRISMEFTVLVKT